MPQDEARFPALDGRQPLPPDYARSLAAIRTRIRTERTRHVLAANAALVLLYWDIGRAILVRQQRSGWGSRVIERLSTDLRRSFPDMRGFSARNLKYMRAFAAAWPDRPIVQEALAQLPWYHQIALLENLKSRKERLWYARACVRAGWAHAALVQQIRAGACKRQGRAIHNFDDALALPASQLAAQAFKDPYLFDFLGTADPRREREVETALVDHIQEFLIELGTGFSFVGRQVSLTVGDQDFQLDLLFYHLRLRCFVVVELKTVPFDPAFVGQLNLYLSAVDDRLRHPNDGPTIGLLLCRSRNRVVVEYALRHLKRPIGVAEWETRLVESLPRRFRSSLPTVGEIESGLAAATLRRSPQSRRPR